jgi:hypothetical protein
MTEEPSTLPELVAGEIRFHQASPPPLPPGGYTVTVTQDIIAGKDTKAYQKTSKFTVSGPRFFLNPAEIYSVYPPTGQFGPFDNALPHIVFTRRTLPWERSAQSKDTPVPWMALVVLGKDDFPDRSIPSIVTRKVGELLSPSANVQGPRGLKLDAGQTNDDLCNTIDLPATTFAAVAPTRVDLTFLAHVREVKTGGKETLSLKQDGWFAVVLANRLPATAKDGKGETNLVCLASLEGFLDLLPSADGKLPAGLNKDKMVRLAVLASWTFTCHGQNDFKTKMHELDDKSVLYLDPKIFGPTADTEAKKAVTNALEMGYIGLNHVTRLGEKTVSWYRGPLVPMQIEPQSPYAFVSCADEALRYDFRVGLFAAEYAAAYELGRMMALQNRSFATAMYRFRNAAALNDTAKLKQSTLMVAFGAPEGKGTLEDAVAGLFVSFGGGSTGESSRSVAAPDLTQIPPEVTQFLARAVLLYGVPFDYLVPDERMLPTESIRFFYLDPGWIDTLVQGAAGVGRPGGTDTVLDERIRFDTLKRAVAVVRERNPASQNEPRVGEANWPLTGFLMRSELVDGWQGVEMRAYGQAEAELAPLRIDRLAPDVMLCIFNGAVMRLTVKQPPEGLHFGLSPKAGQYQRVSLRRVTSDGGEPGAQIPKGSDDKPIDAPMRGITRVVQIAALAETFRTRLSLSKFTSAEFGVQMVESPGLVEFKPRAPAPSPQAFSPTTPPPAPIAFATVATRRRRKLRR